jgi:hypothetical protein
MGSGNAKGGYQSTQYDEEAELRQFEIECGSFRKSLSTLMSRIFIDNHLNISTFENLARKEFSENFVRLIQNDFFYKVKDEKKYYDGKKINLLIFLLSATSLVKHNKLSYHDKSSYIITYVKNNEDENLNHPIGPEDKNFIEFMNDLYDVACIGIVDSFYSFKHIQRDGSLMRLRKVKEQVVDGIIKRIFTMKNKQSDDLGLKDFNEKFDADCFYFTSGFIREQALDLLKKEKIGDSERREKIEEEMKMKNAS